MHKSKEPEPDYSQGPGYETRDLSTGAIFRSVLAMSAVLIAVAAVTYGIYMLFTPKDPTDVAAVKRLTSQPVAPPSPQLQAYPKQEMHEFRAKESALVNGYGRTKEGKVHIPVDKAVELVAQRGFPVTEAKPRQERPKDNAPANGEGQPSNNTPQSGTLPQETSPTGTP